MADLEGWQMTFTEFNRRFEGLLSAEKTYEDAYFVVENQHIDATGKQRYSGYQSFKKARYYHLNKSVSK